MPFGRANRKFHSARKRIFAWMCPALLAVFLGSALGATDGLPSFPAPTQEQARLWYEAARTNYLARTGDTTAAWRFAEACFEWAEFATNSTQRASLANEGIAAAKFAVEMAPDDPGGHFYLAMNKGQLARTKTLGALPLVKEMEAAFRKAIDLDAKFDHAAAERSLGMLYLDAPGWPTSIGSKSKARKHLERAVEVSPEYPTNHLTLMEAYLRWEDSDALHGAMQRYRKMVAGAKTMYAGARWENSWKDWDARWRKILDEGRELFE